jgi:hypothetical protein
MKLENTLVQLDGFNSDEDESQLNNLDRLIEELSSQSVISPQVFESLFKIFERFPDSDGYGLFWGILHFIESRQGYESLLIESVLHKPSQFNLLMINRLINGGLFQIGNYQLLTLLELAINHPDATENSKKDAKNFIEYQKNKLTT